MRKRVTEFGLKYKHCVMMLALGAAGKYVENACDDSVTK